MSNTQEGMAGQDEQILAVTNVLKNLDTNEKQKVDKRIEEVCKEKTNIEVSKEKEELYDDKEDNENEENGEEKENMNTCNFCKKENATKRCSKRHPKCIKKLFCNTTCEDLGHKKKTPAGAAKKTEVKKKKKYTYKEPCQWAL